MEWTSGSLPQSHEVGGVICSDCSGFMMGRVHQIKLRVDIEQVGPNGMRHLVIWTRRLVACRCLLFDVIAGDIDGK